jgi:hypothetical protein
MHQNGMKRVSYRKKEDMWNVVRFFGPISSKLKSGGLYWLFFNMNWAALPILQAAHSTALPHLSLNFSPNTSQTRSQGLGRVQLIFTPSSPVSLTRLGHWVFRTQNQSNPGHSILHYMPLWPAFVGLFDCLDFGSCPLFPFLSLSWVLSFY